MYEIWIEEAGQELHRQVLAEGQFYLGRSSKNQIHIPHSSISRQHLRVDIQSGKIKITDLGSTNGTLFNGQRLAPNRAADWSAGTKVTIGRLIINIRQKDDEEGKSQPSVPDLEQLAEKPITPQAPSGTVPTIVGGAAVPQSTPLKGPPIMIGSAPNCAIRVTASGVALYHCRVERKGQRVELTNLDADNPVKLKGEPIPPGQTVEWPLEEVLLIGTSALYLTQSQSSSQLKSATAVARTRRRYWTLPVILAGAGGLAFICIIALLIYGGRGSGCGLNPGCIIAFVRSSEGGSTEADTTGEATPTLKPRATAALTTPTPRIISLAPTNAATAEDPEECIQQSEIRGWMDLPFPYQGTDPVFGGSPSGFRRVSQKSAFGGRINSFFDHEYPVYPPSVGGREPIDLATTLITFNGQRSRDAFSQDSDDADWYSGHSGIDYAPVRPFEATTPLFASADGRLLRAEIDADGNHMVWLEHVVDGNGDYEYATLYFHLEPDEHFFTMVGTEKETPIQAGHRIGTMGTTGRSSGIHLHFEVRQDINNDGIFSIFERVDPYGYLPSLEIPEDPWGLIVKWSDTKGREYDHKGISSKYLWKHTLVDVVDDAGGCIQASDLQVDLQIYPVLGYAVVNPGFTYIVRNETGDVIREGPPQLRRITVLASHVEGVDISTLGLEYLDPERDLWFSANEDKQVQPTDNGGYIFSAMIRNTGRYVLVAQDTIDRVAPVTRLQIQGEGVLGKQDTYKESVTVSLDPVDRGLVTLQSPIRNTQYSLNCGLSWNTYLGPFTVSLETPHICGQAGTGQLGIEMGENDFLLLAISEDSNDNIEKPPAQARFHIE